MLEVEISYRKGSPKHMHEVIQNGKLVGQSIVEVRTNMDPSLDFDYGPSNKPRQKFVAKIRFAEGALSTNRKPKHRLRAPQID